MVKYQVIDMKTKQSIMLKGDRACPSMLSLSIMVDHDEAARITELDPDDIEWAIEQMGRCDGEDWAILPEGATYTPHDSDNPKHDLGWPELTALYPLKIS